jgi:hypothetical protein
MTGPDENPVPSLIEQGDAAARELRESEPPESGRSWLAMEAALAPVPGRVLGGADVEGQADELADTAARLAGLLAELGQEPRRSLDAIAVFRSLSRTAESMADAAAELRRQEWFDLEDEESPEAASWTAAVKGLKFAASTFGWVADDWI